MPDTSLNIIEFIEHQDLLNDRSHSVWQRTILKAIYGLPLSADEMEIYQRGTGRETYLSGIEQNEVTIIAGRRSGKTSKVGCDIVIYEAFRSHDLPPGEIGFVLLLAPTMAQARIAFRYIRNSLNSSPILRKRIVKQRRNEIELDNGIRICCYPSSYTAVRGITVVATVCDDMAFWRHNENASNPEEEILAALRPCMATITRPKLIKISTPFKKEGILWNEFQRRAELDFQVWQTTTQNMNPHISADVLGAARQRDDRKFRREFMAEFSEDVTGWINTEILEACVVQDRRELPRVPGVSYLAAVDPGYVISEFALVAHRSADGTVVIDRVVRWRGTRETPLSFEWVCGQIRSILYEFDIHTVFGDQYCAAVIYQELLKRGIYYEQFNFGSNTRPQIFGNLKYLLFQRKIELPDDVELLPQFRSLDELQTNRGRIDIRPAGKSRDDLAVAVALASYKLIQLPLVAPPPQLGIIERYMDSGLIPEDCQFAAICLNFPRCLDLGWCQGFQDARATA